MELCEIELCTGCAACANSCPQKLIHMEPDAEGFLRPMVQEKGCIDCGSCENSCPILHPMCYQSNEPTEIKAFVLNIGMNLSGWQALPEACLLRSVNGCFSIKV